MLLLIAWQQSTPMKSLTRYYVIGFLWVRAVTIAMQRLDKRTLNNKATVSVGSVQRVYLEDHQRYKAVLGRRKSWEVYM
jgi:hypothetical protein